MYAERTRCESVSVAACLLRRVPGSAWLAIAILAPIVLHAIWWFVDGERTPTVPSGGFGMEGEVQVVHDGSVIYEFDDVWRFDIADDGSSFFVVEPLAPAARRVASR